VRSGPGVARYAVGRVLVCVWTCATDETTCATAMRTSSYWGVLRRSHPVRPCARLTRISVRAVSVVDGCGARLS